MRKFRGEDKNFYVRDVKSTIFFFHQNSIHQDGEKEKGGKN